MKHLLTILTLILIAFPIQAQKKIEIDKVKIINYGDGRMLHSNLDSEEALEGEHRIIDGYRSAYIQAEFKDGFYHGDFKFYVNNKLIMSGTYTEGVENGLFTDYYADGETIRSKRELTNGKVNGVVKDYDQDGSLIKEKNYSNGIEHGVERIYVNGEKTTERNYSEGKLHGKQIEYISSGRGDYIKRSEFDNGLAIGKYSEEFIKDGLMQVEGTYKKGKKDGKWTHKRKDGTLEKVITYKEGKEDGKSITYYTDGTVEKESEYSQGKLNGVTKNYYWEKGTVKSEYNYKNGKKEGAYKLYYDSGILREEGRCEDDREVLRKEYDHKGELKSVKERTRTGWEKIS